jgi:hypothetical protein
MLIREKWRGSLPNHGCADAVHASNARLELFASQLRRGTKYTFATMSDYETARMAALDADGPPLTRDQGRWR